MFCSLHVAVQLLLSLSVSVAYIGFCERNFSKLKSIKNYLRTTMSQDILKALAILTIEPEIADKVDINVTIFLTICTQESASSNLTVLYCYTL